MMATPELETDALSGLEERIQKAVALVVRLRQEKETILKQVEDVTAAAAAEAEAAKTQVEALTAQAEEAKAENVQLQEELEALRTERKQVRARIEKLLGHIDQLGA